MKTFFLVFGIIIYTVMILWAEHLTALVSIEMLDFIASMGLIFIVGFGLSHLIEGAVKHNVKNELNDIKEGIDEIKQMLERKV